MTYMNRASGYVTRIMLSLVLLISISSVQAVQNSNQAGGLPTLKKAVNKLQVDLSNVELIQGPQGPVGSVGEQGAEGPAGNATVGPQGPIGNTGAKGVDGFGFDGAAGVQGLQGPVGPRGIAAKGRSGIAWMSFYGKQNLNADINSYDGYIPDREIYFNLQESSNQQDIDVVTYWVDSEFAAKRKTTEITLTDPNGIYRIAWQATFIIDDGFFDPGCPGCEFNLEVSIVGDDHQQWFDGSSNYVTMSGSSIVTGKYSKASLRARGSYHGYSKTLCTINDDCDDEKSYQWTGESAKAYPEIFVKSAFMTVQRLN